MRFNGFTIGSGTNQNGNTDYPAPYGNWYWGAKNQMLVLASELTAAGITAGPINDIGFSVVDTDPNTVYDYIDVNMQLTTLTSLSSQFVPVDQNMNQHTNFGISNSGEVVYLYSPSQTLLSQLNVDVAQLDNSNGCLPDNNTGNITLFGTATPGATNNGSQGFSQYQLPPVFSVNAGFYNAPFSVTITNPNPVQQNSVVRYTTDGSEPNNNSTLYTGPVFIFTSTVLRAKCFANGFLPSPAMAASYFIGVDHTTPILSVVTDNANLYGPNGIFDNWSLDWERSAYVEYFDSTKNLIFSKAAGMQIDGGAGGSRSHPQHSFRIELDGALGGGSINYKVIPDRPNRTKYSDFYLRNGSNQWLSYQYKDAAQVRMMCKNTNAYYSAWRPISVYINGQYFGLYELREKFNDEYFKTLEGADTVDILSASFWYGGVLRSVEGSPVDTFYNSYANFNALNPADTAYWNKADKYFDMKYYVDYIISQSWMGNVDWPGNNIKIYRSEKTNRRWRFCTIDQELAMAPNSWTDCTFDHIEFMLGQDPNNPYINVWLKGIQNNRFRHYFINRFADVMNTAYLPENILFVDSFMFNRTVVEMPKHYRRWDGGNVQQRMADFYDNHLIFQSELSQRSGYVRDDIQSNFNLPNQVDLTLNVYPAGAGRIRISTIEPTEYPWQGIYFNGVPIKIEAIANPGYQFKYWWNNGLINDTTNAVFNGILNTFATNFDAYFEVDATPVFTAKAGNFMAYPNPATGQLFIKNNSAEYYNNIQVQVVDLTGRAVLQLNTNAMPASQTMLDISSLAAGTYILQLTNGDKLNQQFRFVKTAQ